MFSLIFLSSSKLEGGDCGFVKITAEDLINVGAYVKNSNSKIDRAIEKFDRIETFLRQRYDTLCSRDDAFTSLREILR